MCILSEPEHFIISWYCTVLLLQVDDQAEETARSTGRVQQVAATGAKPKSQKRTAQTKSKRRRDNQNANNPLFKGYETLLDIDESQLDESVPLPKGLCVYCSNVF